MSRTYRLRHLPKFGAKKFVDASTYKRYNDQITEIREELKPYYEWREIWDYIDRTFVRDVAHPGHHPWVGYGLACVGGKTKSYYRTKGIRQYRRHVKHVIRDLVEWHEHGDSDVSQKTILPLRWFIDKWDVT